MFSGCRTQLATIESKLARVRQDLSSLTNELTTRQVDESMAKNIQGDVALLDQHQTELRKLDKEITKLQEKLPQAGKI